MNARRKNVWLGRTVALFALTALGGPAAAQLVAADTTGNDDFTDAEFYGVDFVAGGPAGSFVQSVTFDISADIDGVFDLDGSANFGNAFEPVVSAGSLIGLTAGDITWDFVGTAPNTITAEFAAGSFGVGDSFRFGCDTDFFVGDPCPGGNFGTGGAILSVVLEGGESTTAAFTTVTSLQSVAEANFDACLLSLHLPEQFAQAGSVMQPQVGLLHRPDTPATTKLHTILFDPAGEILADWKSAPLHLAPGELVTLEPTFQIPAHAAPGTYRVGVAVGEMYQGHVSRFVDFHVGEYVPAEKDPEKTGRGLAVEQHP